MNDDNLPSQEPKSDGGKKPRRRKPETGDRFDWRKATRTLTLWVLFFLLTWIVYRQLSVSEPRSAPKSYSEYLKLLEEGQIDGAEVIDREFHGRLKDGTGIVTALPFIDARMLSQWDSLKIDYQFKEKTTNWVGILVTSVLPWVVVIAFWLYLMRRMQGGGAKGVFSFGKSRAKLLVENKPKVTFKDVAGVDEAKEELQEVIGFLRDPKKFARLGGRIPKGALLLGPPGTGKTLLARAVAGEAEVPFYSMSGADFVEMFVGVGAARVRDLFEQGKKNAPCIIFIDEIDAVGRHRGAGMGGGHDEREQTLNQLLVEMDGFESNEGVILLAATNRPDVLDPALTRPGRFDRQIVVDRPDVRGREGILKVHTRNIPLANDVRMEVLAKGTPGLAGADLANMVNEAALLAARRNANQVSMVDFEEAKDKVMMGTERKSMVISDDERRQTAYHEAGHVLVAKLTPGTDPVHKVTIIPRGRALGLTHYLPLDEKHNYSRSYLNQTLTHFLGGRAAEKLIFHEQSTGAGNDLERATEIARKMVCEWGMSDRVGPVVFGKKNEEIFLGRDFGHAKEYSERTAQDIDMELRRIITDAEKRAERLIADNLAKLKVLAEALLEREILDGEEIDTLLKGRQLPPMVPKNAEAPAPQLPRREPRRRRPPLDKPASPQVEAARARREFARSFGVASSRDPENRRPVKFGRPVRPAPKPPESGEGAATEPPAPPQTPTETSPEFKAGFVPKGRAPRHRPPRRGWSSRRLDQPAGHEPGASSEPEPKLEVSESLPRPMLPEIKPEPALQREHPPPPPPAERRPEPPSSPSLQREYPPPPPPVEQRPEPPSSPSGYQPPPPSDYHGGEGGD